MKLPKSRTENIVVQNLNDETLIYDLLANKAFCLNETSAKVFNACGNAATFAELRDKYKFADEIIYLSLDELKKNNLLAEEFVSPFAGMNRREVIRKVGIASMIALPVISSLIAPTAAHAQSGGGPAACTAAPYPSGCPVGVPETGGGSCASISDPNKSQLCNVINGGDCLSGNAEYIPGSCVDSGGTYTYQCRCS